MNYEKLKNLIKQHEGLRLTPYKDTVGKWTIGYGRNLSDNGISEREAELFLDSDINNAYQEVMYVIPNFEELSENRQIVLVDMLFNLGAVRFAKFGRMIKAIKECDFKTAAEEMLDSLWARQVKGRAYILAEMMEQGG